MTTTIGSLDINTFSDLYSDLTQYFWFEGDASATYGAGVHITLSPDASFIANPSGQNILINTDGISIRNGLVPMMTLDNNSLDFNVINTTTGTYTNVASFGSTTTIGGTSSKMVLSENDIILYGENGQLAKYGASAIIGDENDFHIEVGGTEIGFYQASQKVAYINGNKLYITQSVVLQQMDVGTPVSAGGLGQWSWKVHEVNGANNLYLKWLG